MLHNFIVPSTHSPLTEGHIEAPSLLDSIPSWAGKEAYYCIWDLEPRSTFKDYQGESIPALGTVCFDFDSDADLGASALEDVKAFTAWLAGHHVPHQVWFSGNKGFHIYAPATAFAPLTPMKDWSRRLTSMAFQLKDLYQTLDTSVFGSSRKLRLPLSRHPKTGLYKRPCNIALDIAAIRAEAATLPGPTEANAVLSVLGALHEYDGPRVYDLMAVQAKPEVVETRAGSPSTPAAPSQDHEFARFPKKPCIKALQGMQTAPGGRHDVALILASDYFNTGVPRPEAVKRLKQWAENNGLVAENRWSEMEGMLEEVYSGRFQKAYGCNRPEKQRQCTSRCPIWKKLNPETRHVPLDAPAKKASLAEMAERREEVMIALAIDHAKSSRIVTLRTSEATYVYEPRLGHYRSTGHLELTNVAATLLESYNTTVTDPDAVIPRTLTIIKDMQHLLRVKSTVDQDWFINCAQKYINMRSGFLDLTTLAFIKKDSEIGSKLEKELGFLYLLDYDFDEHAAAPRWDQFLREIFPEDTEALSLLIKEWIGYCVSNDMQWAEKSMALVGSGANGKSVLINLLKSLVGTANVSAIQMSDLGKDYSVAMLEHSFVNLCSEMPRATSMLAARIKALSSQEDMQMARRPYEKPFSFLSRAKLMFAGNEVPDTYDNSDGFYRRFILVPFKASFMGENCDPHLIKKLRMERPGILAQCLRAYQEARERKHFTLPSSVVAAQEDMRGKNDTMGGWIETCLERDVDGTLYREQMAASYAAYAQSIGDRMQRGDQATLAHRIVAAVGGEMVKSGRVIVRIKGVRLKDAPREF